MKLRGVRLVLPPAAPQPRIEDVRERVCELRSGEVVLWRFPWEDAGPWRASGAHGSDRFLRPFTPIKTRLGDRFKLKVPSVFAAVLLLMHDDESLVACAEGPDFVWLPGQEPWVCDPCCTKCA